MWGVTRDDVRKEMTWKPIPAWSDASAAWKDAETLAFDYTIAGEDKRRTQTRKLSDSIWVKAP